MTSRLMSMRITIATVLAMAVCTVASAQISESDLEKANSRAKTL